jgi:hypothetical protein
MEGLVKFFKYVSENWDLLLGSVNALIFAMISIALMIPGEQPEKFLRGVVDFLSKLSRKPKE